ncbi:hypothetical protein [Haloarchaeobius sp. TZWSO28]|uniref:hypothetical protein n=1 Tax=Haloarchaeobius sp. TZWSO28 TaxID=3446119 RepID=UPI003EB9C669
MLKGGGASIAASALATSGIVGMAGSAFGLNSKGAPVIVVQSPPGKHIDFERRQNITDRVYEEAIDRGREPPREKGGIKESGEKNSPIVAHVNTITDEGIPRRHHQQASAESTGYAHASAMGRAKKLAEKNGSEIEIHRPNAPVETIAPEDVGKARRATDIPGQTAGFNQALLDSTFATLDEGVKRFSSNLDASLSMAEAYDEEVDLVWSDSIAERDEKGIGKAEVWYDVRHSYSSEEYDLDPYEVGGWFWQQAGEEAYGNDWENNYAKVDHNWPHSDSVNVDEVKDWVPNGDESSLSSVSRSISVGIGVSADGPSGSVSYGVTETIEKDGARLDDRSDPIDEYVAWTYEYNTPTTKTGSVRLEFGSIARQDTYNCTSEPTWYLEVQNEAGYKQRGHSCGWDCIPRDSYYMNYLLGVSC